MMTVCHTTLSKRLVLASIVLASCLLQSAWADDQQSGDDEAAPHVNMDVLKAEQWDEIDTAIDRALKFLVQHQRRNGAFEADDPGQPAITSLAVMAILSSGEVPGQGPYADQLKRAIDYAINVQQPDGRLAFTGANPILDLTTLYNHGMTGLMLSEVYGMSGTGDQDELRTTVNRALKYSRRMQTQAKRSLGDKGGWRYLRRIGPNDSDLSATSWQLMFYRSAKNAGFEVPVEFITDAMGYVHRNFDEEVSAFVYAQQPGKDRERYPSGGSVGGGMIALAMAGEHRSPSVLKSADWILAHPFDDYNRREHPEDRYHFSAFYCSQAMYQVGGLHWEKFYPDFARVLLDNQNPDGSWEPESHPSDKYAGNVYTTALVVLALTPPFQGLPIYQR